MNMLVSGAALVLACAAFIAYDVVSFRQAMERNLSIQAQMVGSNSAAALLFDDPQAAEKTLSALQAAPNIVSAGIYTPDGQPFAGYWRDGEKQLSRLPALSVARSQVHWLRDRRIVLVHVTLFQGKTVGFVYIQSDLQDLLRRMRHNAGIAAGVFLASLFVALLASGPIRRIISDRIVNLAETARLVSRQKTYSVRARGTSDNDELAVLIDSFNEMLAQIEGRDSTLLSEIGERKAAEEALRESQNRVTGVIASAMDAILSVDEEQKIVLFNGAAERIFGSPAAEAIGQSIERFIPQRFRARHSDHIRRFGKTGVTGRAMGTLGELWALRSDGEEFPVEASISQVEVGGRKLFTVILRDVTQNRAAEREIRRLNDELEQRVIERTAQLEAANKELESFSYSVSHDLRAPLRHISGFARILTEEFGPSLPEEAQRHLARIEQGTNRMGRLVDELLSLTRTGRQSLAIQVTELSTVVHDVIAMLEPESEGRTVEWKIGDLPLVECDPTLIRQVFQNLISNGLKYSRPRAQAVIEIGQTERAGETVIFVRDNGVGFSMKYADKLFGVFQRLHGNEEFEGNGVGLATVHRIVEKHGGRVWAEAELDRGACFYFTLNGLSQPATTAQAAGAEESHEH